MPKKVKKIDEKEIEKTGEGSTINQP